MDRFVSGTSKAHYLKDAFSDPVVFLCGKTADRNTVTVDNDADVCKVCEKAYEQTQA